MKITNWLQSCRRTLRAFAVGCLSPVGVLSALAGGLLFGAASAQAGNVTIVDGQIKDGGTVVGTATPVGSDMVLQFNVPRSGMTWTVPSGVTKVRYLVVGGGGGGGGGYGGGGGAGGFIEAKNETVNPNDTYTITVGAGGDGGTGNNYNLEICAGANGGKSLFGSVEALGGGGGGCYKVFAKDGGSGGGASIDFGSKTAHNPGKGTSGQGNDGGTGYLTTEDKGAGGGGGAGDVGESGTLTKSGNGGPGKSSDITGSANWYAGGGGGFGNGTMDYGRGTNGGGDGSSTATSNGSAATTPGSGGGGAIHGYTGGAGADGVVIVRYQANISYTVTFNANGGNTPSPASMKVTNGQPYGTLATCSRTGYTFAGWWTSAGGGTQVTSATTVDLSANQTLYAHWTPNQYTVTLNKNATDATAGTASVTATYGAAMPSATMPTREGYVFRGYYDTSEATGGNLYYSGSGVSARNWDKTANTTLYARWAEPVDPGDMPEDWGYVTNYTQNSKIYVAYVYTNPAPETVSGPMTFTVPKGVTSLDYLVVGGGGGGGGAFGGGGGAGGFLTGTLSSGLATSYAITVGVGGAGAVGNTSVGGNGGYSSLGTVVALGGGGGATYNVGVTASAGGCGGGGSAGKGDFAPVAGAGTEGQGFAGGNGVAASVAGGGGGAGGPGVAGVTEPAKKSGDGGDGKTSDITGVTCKYAGGGGGCGDEDKYNLTAGSGAFGGGDGGVDQGSGGDATTPGSGGGGAARISPYGTSAGRGGNGADGIVVVRYAEVPQTYTVFFNANGGGTPAPTSKTVTQGQTYGALATCSRTGYTFNGWYTAASSGTKVETTTTVDLTADQVLYAQWTADNYTITVNQDSGSGGTISQGTYTIGEVDQTRTMTTNPTRSGYTFAGWTVSSAPTSGSPSFSGSTLTIPAGTYGNFTVKATWLQNMVVTSADYTGQYDGNAHGITLTVTTPASGATIRYRTSESGAYDLTIAPTRKDVGTTTVYYQITAPDFVTTTGSKTITINRARTATEPTKADRTYNGTDQEGYLATGNFTTLTGDKSATDAGTYTFYAEPDANHAWSDGTYGKKSYTWSIGAMSIEGGWTKSGYWTSEPITPPLSVSITDVGNQDLVWNVDYTVTINGVPIESADKMPVDIKSYSVKFEGIGNYSGTFTPKPYETSTDGENWSIVAPTYTWNAGADGNWAEANWTCNADGYMEEHGWNWPQKVGHAAVIDGPYAVTLTGGNVTNVVERLTLKNGASIKGGTIEAHSWSIDISDNTKTVFENVRFVAKGANYTISPNAGAELELRGNNKFESNGGRPYLQFQQNRANSLMRFRDGTTDHTHMQIIFYDSTGGTTDVVPKTMEITNAVLKVDGLAPTKIDPVLLSIALGENNKEQSQSDAVAAFNATGAVDMPVGSSLTVDAGQKGVGTYPLLRFGSWTASETDGLMTLDDFIATATADGKAITGVADGLRAKVVKTSDGKGFDLVIFHKGLILSFGPAN